MRGWKRNKRRLTSRRETYCLMTLTTLLIDCKKIKTDFLAGDKTNDSTMVENLSDCDATDHDNGCPRRRSDIEISDTNGQNRSALHAGRHH